MNEIDVLNTRFMNSRLLLQDFEDPRILDINNLSTLFSIIEYAQEPLLPLNEACAPLTSIVDNVLTHALVAMARTPDQPANGLTRNESASIRLYTMECTNRRNSVYFVLNKSLNTQDPEKLRPWFKYLKLLLTSLVKIPCAPAQTVWRGVRADISGDFPDGAQVIWWAFSSCTTTLPVLESNAYLGNRGPRTLFSIEIINGRSVRAHSHFDTEDEILMLPGTFMEVQSQMTQESGLHIIHLKQKIPIETLLEPPFQGILSISIL